MHIYSQIRSQLKLLKTLCNDEPSLKIFCDGMTQCLRLCLVQLLRFGIGFCCCLHVERIWRDLTAGSFQPVCENV